jgi:hypothetical protein
LQWFYHIWLQRNAIRHGSTPRFEEQILNAVISDIKHRVNCKGRFKLLASNVVRCEKTEIKKGQKNDGSAYGND